MTRQVYSSFGFFGGLGGVGGWPSWVVGARVVWAFEMGARMVGGDLESGGRQNPSVAGRCERFHGLLTRRSPPCLRFPLRWQVGCPCSRRASRNPRFRRSAC